MLVLLSREENKTVLGRHFGSSVSTVVLEQQRREEQLTTYQRGWVNRVASSDVWWFQWATYLLASCDGQVVFSAIGWQLATYVVHVNTIAIDTYFAIVKHNNERRTGKCSSWNTPVFVSHRSA
jgi:hypothetical protein